jgi:hypothetical protein
MTKHVNPPGSPQDAPLYVKTDIPSETVFVAIGQLRKEARDEIHRLIQFLDKTDDYVSRELEEGIDDVPHDGGDDDEPSLTGLTAGSASQFVSCCGIEDGEQEQEDEPSLGSVCQFETTSQDGGNWSAGGSADLEDEHDGAEPENEHGDNDDREPSLGWTVDGVVSNTSIVGCDAGLERRATPKPRTSRISPLVSTNETYCTWRRHLKGLTARQREIVRPRLDTGAVSLL